MREGLVSGGNCAEAVLRCRCPPLHFIPRNHILPNVICSGIVEGRVKTNNQLSSLLLLARSEAGEVTVDGARLEVRDVMATNGVIHLIDRVLIPDSAKVNPSNPPPHPQSISASLSTRPRLAALLETSGLADQFYHLSNATLFLPSGKLCKIMFFGAFWTLSRWPRIPTFVPRGGPRRPPRVLPPAAGGGAGETERAADPPCSQSPAGRGRPG